jgi:hypothetical protein
MTKKEKDKGTDRQPYRKPQLEQVSLAVEEAVLTACKNVTVGGKNSPDCRPNTSACKTVWTGS